LQKRKLVWRWRQKKIVSRFDAIHGHFVADTFNFLPVPKQLCVFLRDPADRLISHYLYWTKPGEKFPRNSVLDRLIRNRLTINEFAALPQMVNFYSIFLGKMSLDKFDFVGLREEYSTSLRLFGKIFSIKLEERRDNVVDAERYEDVLSSVDLAKLQQSQAKNREIYDQARRRFDLLCSQYL